MKHMATKPEGFWWWQKGELRRGQGGAATSASACPAGTADSGYIDFQVIDDTPDRRRDARQGDRCTSRSKRASCTRSARSTSIGNRRFSHRGTDGVLSRSGRWRRAARGKVGGRSTAAPWEKATEKVTEPVRQQRLHLRPGGAGGDPADGAGRHSRWSTCGGPSARDSRPPINKINIVGNDVTHERVIREAIVLLPGPAVQPRSR